MEETLQELKKSIDKSLINLVRNHFRMLDDSERLTFMDSIFEDYCQYCGKDIRQVNECYCMADD